jgi:transposase
MRQFIGLDIHRKFIQVCVMDQSGVVSRQLRLELQEPERLREFFRGFDPQDTQAVMEATIGWMWLADLLQGLGIEVHLAHMQGVHLIAQSHRKTDKIDARILADLLRTNFLPEAYLAPPPLREDRMVLRHRQALVACRTSAKNRIHALLARYNIHLPHSDIFGVQGLEALRALELPEEAARIRDDELLAIEFLGERIKVVQNRLYARLAGDRRVDWLMSIPGVGKLSAHYLLAEIGTIERFLSPAKLASYCGLCSSTSQSADKVRQGRTWGGRSLLKWTLVEAAHTAVRRDSYFARIFQRVAKRRGTGRAYVAVARKMACIIWQMLKEGRDYIPKTKTIQVGSSPL